MAEKKVRSNIRIYIEPVNISQFAVKCPFKLHVTRRVIRMSSYTHPGTDSEHEDSPEKPQRTPALCWLSAH